METKERKDLNLCEFIVMIQKEIQNACEYLAREELRGISKERPSEVFFSIEKVRLETPVEFYYKLREKLKEEEIKESQYNLLIKIHEKVTEEEKGLLTGKLEITFLPVAKQE
jgi:hypothetical protein